MHFWAPFALFAGVSGFLMDKVDHVPHGWSEIGPPSPSTRFKLSIALIPANKELLHETLANISTPGHEDYGKHLNESELRAVVRLSENSTNAVLKFLEDSGIPRSDFIQHGDWIDVTTDLKTANKMMDPSFKTYREETGRGIVIVRTKEYSLPERVARHVDMIEPTTQFPRETHPRKPSSIHIEQALQNPIDLNDCNRTITPKCLRKLYVQYAAAMGYPLPITFYSTHGLLGRDNGSNRAISFGSEIFLVLVRYLREQPKELLPHTLSISYGGPESDVPDAYLRKTCDMFGELGARGVTVLVASGDNGVSYHTPTSTTVSERTWPNMNHANLQDQPKPQICRLDNKRFVPVFPGACPYVTSVGGTNFVDPEAGASDSTGGFSEFFPRPDWQTNAVEPYLDTLGTRWSGLYNSGGRGSPDIAAQMEDYSIYNSLLPMAVSGTSASAPTVAGIVGLVNSALIDAGKSPLGFMNPFLYSVGHKAFQDIVNGSSKGCGEKVSSSGWDTAEGWDPVTGLRTPDYQKLLSTAMQQHA